MMRRRQPMQSDPVVAAMDRVHGPSRAWFAAIDRYVMIGSPSVADVEALGIVAQCAWAEVMEVAMQQRDEGSGERPYASGCTWCSTSCSDPSRGTRLLFAGPPATRTLPDRCFAPSQ